MSMTTLVQARGIARAKMSWWHLDLASHTISVVTTLVAITIWSRCRRRFSFFDKKIRSNVFTYNCCFLLRIVSPFLLCKYDLNLSKWILSKLFFLQNFDPLTYCLPPQHRDQVPGFTTCQRISPPDSYSTLAFKGRKYYPQLPQYTISPQIGWMTVHIRSWKEIANLNRSFWKPNLIFELQLTLYFFWFPRLVMKPKCLDKLLLCTSPTATSCKPRSLTQLWCNSCLQAVYGQQAASSVGTTQWGPPQLVCTSSQGWEEIYFAKRSYFPGKYDA